MDDLHWLLLRGAYVLAVGAIVVISFGVVGLAVVFLAAFTGKVHHEGEDK